MKRIITVFMVLILAVLSLSARPQFYFELVQEQEGFIPPRN